MNAKKFLFGLGLLLATGPALAGEDAERVSVAFAESERYLDAGDHARDRQRNLSLIEGFLVAEIGACLGGNERVVIRVLDVDLAGYYEWWQPGGGVRVMRDVDWPRIKLEFQRQDRQGEIVEEGSAWVSDMSYLSSPQPSARDGRLPFERRMIRAWAREHFCD
jgi:hypothetical protein